MDQFHFIRPEWFYALIPLLIIYSMLLRQRLQSRSWQSFCEPELLPHLFNSEQITQRKRPLVLFLITGLLVITALAGPSWEKRPQPVFKKQSALVIALDLSRSMDAVDIKPSRLKRALHKIEDILQKRKEGQTALVAYADNAFAVTPLTNDIATISSQVKSLSTDIMPVQGSHPERALSLAYDLFKQASYLTGHIILITDGVSENSLKKIQQQRQSAYSISVLAIGSAEGSPIPLSSGGFFKDSQGGIVIPKMETQLLRQLAFSGAGSLRTLSANDSDLTQLLAPLDSILGDDNKQATELNTDSWFEAGPWLLLLVMPLATLAFRKGYLFSLVFFLSPLPEPAYAFDWQQLWKNNNQQAQQLLKEDKASEAAEKFTDKKWKAAAQYKAGQFDQALESYQQLDQTKPDNLYNLANTQAQLGQFDQALETYNKLIEMQPDHADAKNNRDLTEKIKQQQQSNQQKQKGSQSDQQQQKDSADQSDQDGQTQDKQQSTEAKDSAEDQQQFDQQQSDQQNSESDDKANQAEKKSVQEDQGQEQAQHRSEKEKPEEVQSKTTDNSLSKEQQQANEQWLRRIPDDPGGLLRRKFKYQSQQQPQPKNGEPQW